MEKLIQIISSMPLSMSMWLVVGIVILIAFFYQNRRIVLHSMLSFIFDIKPLEEGESIFRAPDNNDHDISFLKKPRNNRSTPI